MKLEGSAERHREKMLGRANLPCSWELQAGSPLAGRAAGVVATLADPAAAAIAASLPVTTVPPVVAVAAHVPGSQQRILMLLPPVGGHRVSAMPMLNVSWRSWAVTSAPICCTMEETRVGSSLPTSARRKLKNRVFDGDKASINAQSYFSDISTKIKLRRPHPPQRSTLWEDLSEEDRSELPLKLELSDLPLRLSTDPPIELPMELSEPPL